MRKVCIQIEEKICYEEEIIVIQPNNMSDDEFEKALEKAEKETNLYEGGAKDMASILRNAGITVESESFNFPDNPRDSELEIIDVRDAK
ncbi:hypothetical protein ACIQD3_22600 [Peribacillus loiseleuriae]|uniref:hypothetical protein n=1 Tax=Peribacillus loiseleuriae TaxID=1679170 RepID=UPI003802B811